MYGCTYLFFFKEISQLFFLRGARHWCLYAALISYLSFASLCPTLILYFLLPLVYLQLLDGFSKIKFIIYISRQRRLRLLRLLKALLP